MNKRTARIALLIVILFAVAPALWAVRGHERTLAAGEIVRLQLAPVDPRSLMQGDYMALRFALERTLPRPSEDPSLDTVEVEVDEANRAVRIVEKGSEPGTGKKVLLKVRTRNGAYKLGPNAFFFQEGMGDTFSNARWGEFRVAADGTALLTYLLDEELNRLGENQR